MSNPNFPNALLKHELAPGLRIKVINEPSQYSHKRHEFEAVVVGPEWITSGGTTWYGVAGYNPDKQFLIMFTIPGFCARLGKPGTVLDALHFTDFGAAPYKGDEREWWNPSNHIESVPATRADAMKELAKNLTPVVADPAWLVEPFSCECFQPEVCP